MRLWIISLLLLGQVACLSAQNSLPSSTTGDAKEEKPELWAKSVLGKTAPRFMIDKWVNHAPDSVAMKGKCMLIHYWSPMYAWGAYLTIPRFNRLSKEWSKELVIIGVTDAAAEQVDNITPVMEYPYASAPKMIDDLEVKHFCYALFVDSDGIVRWEGCPFLKGQHLSDKALKALISQYKKKTNK